MPSTLMQFLLDDGITPVVQNGSIRFIYTGGGGVTPPGPTGPTGPIGPGGPLPVPTDWTVMPPILPAPSQDKITVTGPVKVVFTNQPLPTTPYLNWAKVAEVSGSNPPTGTATFTTDPTMSDPSKVLFTCPAQDLYVRWSVGREDAQAQFSVPVGTNVYLYVPQVPGSVYVENFTG